MPSGGTSKRDHSCLNCGAKVPEWQKMIQTINGRWALLCAKHRKQQQGA